MSYDFNEPVDRRGSGSYKWDVKEGELPMWVADMDFKTAPTVQKALAERVEHGVFGYSVVPDQWYEAYIGWWKERHSFEIDRDWLIFTSGVVPAISSAVRKLTTPAEKVLIQSPVYNIFYNSIVNNGRYVLESPLIQNGSGYAVDFDDLEEKLSDPQTTLMILCNPHNPVGRIWDRETLSRIADLCIDNNVAVISDEIHCDLTDPGHEYIPFASVSSAARENSVSCISASKAFNLAGLHSAAVVVPGMRLRNKMNRGLNTDEVAEPNAFAVTAAIAAFSGGAGWLDDLREYLFRNKKLVRSFIEKEIPGVRVVPSEATYLLWLDCREVSSESSVLYAHLRETTGLYLTEGDEYGSGGQGYLRMNIACPENRVRDGLMRLKEGIEGFK